MTDPKLQKLGGRWTFTAGSKTAPKRQIERDTSAFAEGGKTHMLGQGDRTVTATSDAAGQQTAGQTANRSKDNRRFAKGGPKNIGYGLALPAVGGATAPTRLGRGR
jgi:hypothetical protein